MRAPNPKTLSAAIVKAEAFRPCAGTTLHLTPAEARALIYETSATQCCAVYDGNVSPRAYPMGDAWNAAGYRHVQRITGAWDTRPAVRPRGPVFVVTVDLGHMALLADIVTAALQAPKAPKAEG